MTRLLSAHPISLNFIFFWLSLRVEEKRQGIGWAWDLCVCVSICRLYTMCVIHIHWIRRVFVLSSLECIISYSFSPSYLKWWRYVRTTTYTSVPILVSVCICS